jgi:plastocyanin
MKIRRILILLLPIIALAWFPACKSGSNISAPSYVEPNTATATQLAVAPVPAVTTLQATAADFTGTAQTVPAASTSRILPASALPLATETDSRPRSVNVGAASDGFSPAVARVAIGVTVAWGKSNCCDADFSIVSDSPGFTGGFVSPEIGYAFTFSTPGTYNYHLEGDPDIKGTVIVG